MRPLPPSLGSPLELAQFPDLVFVPLLRGVILHRQNCVPAEDRTGSCVARFTVGLPIPEAPMASLGLILPNNRPPPTVAMRTARPPFGFAARYGELVFRALLAVHVRTRSNNFNQFPDR